METEATGYPATIPPKPATIQNALQLDNRACRYSGASKKLQMNAKYKRTDHLRIKVKNVGDPALGELHASSMEIGQR